ncbi:MAG: alkaline phosphatase D family protein [Rhizobacter sp.]
MPDTRIAFTSCFDTTFGHAQPVWARIQAQRPDALLLLGDSIYMDWGLETREAVPVWKRDFLADPARGLARFRQTLYDRYRAQWEHPDFQALVRSMNGQVRVVRDDHDFAWNDCTAAGDQTRGRYVPPPMQAVSHRLFRQFAAALVAPPATYPSLDASDLLPATPLWKEAWTVAGVPVLMLDQRSACTDIKDPAPSLLGDGQAQWLYGQVEADGGLLIVAGATPMRHGRGGWVKTGQQAPFPESWAFPEYRGFLDAAERAERPVLYLAGDIHRNDYGGPVEHKSPVIQVVSSGAAQPWLKDAIKIGLPLFFNKSEKFGMLHLQGLDADRRNGTVRIELHEGEKVDPPIALTFSEGEWHKPPRGSIRDLTPEPLNAQ